MDTVDLAEAVSLLLEDARVSSKTGEIHTGSRNFFVHIRLPDHIRHDLEAVQRKIIPDTAMPTPVDHITLVHVGKPRDDHDAQKVHAALNSLREIGQRTEPISARIQGIAYFDGASNDGKPSTALVALIDAPGLTHLHVDMSRALKEHGINPSDNHGYVAHATLGYLGDKGRVDSLPAISGKFTIEKVHVAARDHHEIPLSYVKSLGAKAAEFAWSPVR